MVDSALYTIVCGMPRCGTRQFADLLNRDERVCLQGEINAALIRPMFELLIKADDVYRNSKHQKLYYQKRSEAFIELVSLFSKGRKRIKEKANVQGFKTPNIEFYHEELSAMIMPAAERLSYLYCIRNIKDCFLSLLAMPWFKRTPEQYVKKYVKSLKTALAIRKGYTNNNSTVTIDILHLDEFIRTEDKALWIVERLFKPLMLELPLKQSEKYFERTKNSNSTVRKTGKKRETQLPEAVENLFQSQKEKVNSTITAFNKAFHTDLAVL